MTKKTKGRNGCCRPAPKTSCHSDYAISTTPGISLGCRACGNCGVCLTNREHTLCGSCKAYRRLLFAVDGLRVVLAGHRAAGDVR